MLDFKELHQNLFEMKDVDYRYFQMSMLPMVDKETVIGIRYVKLVKFAKTFFNRKTKADFINQLPHQYFEENLIHIWIINGMKNYYRCIKAVKNFLPYINNWAVCDSLIPKIFAKNTKKFIKEIKIWLDSDETYTVRFAISMLRKFYLDENFDKKYLQMVANIKTNDYYVGMAAAWFFTDALIKQYDDTIILLQENLLYKKIHTKTIQKAVESTRLSDEQKEYLKTLRRR